MENKKFKSNDNFVVSVVAGETVIVPITGEVAQMNNLFVLNDTGAFILEKINNSLTISEIADAMAEEFEAPQREILVADVNEFIAEMIKRGFITEI